MDGRYRKTGHAGRSRIRERRGGKEGLGERVLMGLGDMEIGVKPQACGKAILRTTSKTYIEEQVFHSFI